MLIFICDILICYDSFSKGNLCISFKFSLHNLSRIKISWMLYPSQEKLTKEINSMEGRLNNPKFVNSAPPEVVNETRDNVVKRKEERTRAECVGM